MITGINELKTLTKHISCESKCRFDGRKSNSHQCWNDDNFNMSVKNVMYVNKIMFGMLLHVVVKKENIQQVLKVIQQLYVMKLQGHTTKKQKQILMKKNSLINKKILYFACIFINYYNITDSCQYLMLFDKISSKTKAFITISIYK